MTEDTSLAAACGDLKKSAKYLSSSGSAHAKQWAPIMKPLLGIVRT